MTTGEKREERAQFCRLVSHRRHRSLRHHSPGWRRPDRGPGEVQRPLAQAPLLPPPSEFFSRRLLVSPLMESGQFSTGSSFIYFQYSPIGGVVCPPGTQLKKTISASEVLATVPLSWATEEGRLPPPGSAQRASASAQGEVSSTLAHIPSKISVLLRQSRSPRDGIGQISQNVG